MIARMRHPGRLGIALATAAVAAVAFATGVAGVGLQPFRGLGQGESILERQVATVPIAVVAYDAENALCVTTASGRACTVVDATEPMVSVSGLPDGRIAVVVLDPQRRVDVLEVVVNGAVKRTSTSSAGLAVEAVLNEPPQSIRVLDASGKELFSTGRSLIEAREEADAAVNREPSH